MDQLFIENLTVIDFAYLDGDRGLVGESWIVDLLLGGELDDQGMVFDFGNVKRTIKRLIDEEVDHRLLVPADYSGLSWPEDEPETLIWTLRNGQTIRHQGPAQSYLKLSGERLTSSTVARTLEQALKAVLPANVQTVELTLREEAINGPFYHYVHGLKKHRGNCQRIAHGHRSPIRIERNGRRDAELESWWARRWHDIYIGTEEDIAHEEIASSGEASVTFVYEADQGEFSLTLPKDRVYLLATDTTVEFIAAHLADECKRMHPTDLIRVKAYEGVGKGAIASR